MYPTIICVSSWTCCKAKSCSTSPGALLTSGWVSSLPKNKQAKSNKRPIKKRINVYWNYLPKSITQAHNLNSCWEHANPCRKTAHADFCRDASGRTSRSSARHFSRNSSIMVRNCSLLKNCRLLSRPVCAAESSSELSPKVGQIISRTQNMRTTQVGIMSSQTAYTLQTDSIVQLPPK